MIALLALIGGLVGLVVGGHLVVAGASDLGARLGLTPVVIGLTIVAAGTSAPELAVVAQSVAVGDAELAVGSVIGSNIANVLLVLGLAATLGTIRVASRVVRVDIPIMIGASVLFLLLALDHRVGRLDGAVFFAGAVGFVGWTLRAARRTGAAPDAADPAQVAPPIRRAVIGLIVGVGALAIASRFVVSGAEAIATELGVPELIVGLTVVALGTSAPEIVTTLLAALQGRRDLAVGNAVGSNIFNILLVLGAPALLAADGIRVSADAVRLDLPILVATAVACLPIVYWDHKLDRWQGGVFVAYYVAYLTFLALDATDHGAADPFALVLLGFVLPLTVLTVAIGVSRQRRAMKSSPTSTIK